MRSYPIQKFGKICPLRVSCREYPRELLLMEEISVKTSKILKIYLELSQFPILADEIRQRMREELYRRRIISPVEFEQEVEEKAVQSQFREGLTDPYAQETHETWERRVKQVRDHLTDFYFAYNLPHDLFRQLVQNALRKQNVHPERVLTFNPELAPWAILFDKAEAYQKLPPEERTQFAHHLQEIQVVITKGLISDQLRFVGISRKYFSVADLKRILEHRVGRGKIGGKAAGMYLAYKILTSPHNDDRLDISRHVVMPKSYYIGADVFYDFLSQNGLLVYMNQKYREPEQIRAEAATIQQAYLQGVFPQKVKKQIARILEEMNGKPLIVRSSSLLEDRFESSFAGKYDSYFCPNQGTPEENLENLIDAIKRVYASTVAPDALLYRRNRGLLDYDERMAILIQEVVGTRYKNYFFPMLAGVGFSRNPFRWNQKIDPRSGFIRLVWGLGTRAVDRVANDYPRMVALSHPLLRPETSRAEIMKYSQHYVDLLDLQDNSFKTLPVAEVIGDDYPAIQYLASVDKGDYLQPIHALGAGLEPDKLVLTFDNLLKNTSFVPIMNTVLRKLERAYKSPVDMEFAVEIIPGYPYPDFKIYILQCRPLVEQTFMEQVEYPAEVLESDILFTTHKWTASGQVDNIRYIVYIDPRAYDAITDYPTKMEIGRAVSRLNKALEGETFILLGPGRWGSSNIDLGVKVTYADIYNTALLGEIAFAHGNQTPEVSYGTHFFQDLVEAKIYPLPIYPDAPGVIFNEQFFHTAPNCLSRISPQDEGLADYIKVIDVPAASGGKKMCVVMDGEKERAIGYLTHPRPDETAEEDEELAYSFHR
ncbi:MAG: phosphoenolpyruvate synthase [Caldilineae bacterium]|nr:MAG: phosphoenolpyruvate synthase [Caldilineae bacterium]